MTKNATTTTPDQQFATGQDTAPAPSGTTAEKPVSADPAVPATGGAGPDKDAPNKAETTEIVSSAANDQTTAPVTDVATAADAGGGKIDAQAAAKAGRAKREAAEAAKKTASAGASGPVPSGNVVRQLEDGAETDRRAGANADKSLAGENLPVLRQNEPDPRQGVTTGDLTDPGVREGEATEMVTFKAGYHLYNRGETARFNADEAARLRALDVVE